MAPFTSPFVYEVSPLLTGLAYLMPVEVSFSTWLFTIAYRLCLNQVRKRRLECVVRLEHPQIIAIVLSYLESDQAAEVVGLLPENTHSDILLRVANLDRVNPQALEELDRVMGRQLAGGGGGKSSHLGGVKVAAGILNNVDTSLEESIISQIKGVDPELGSELEDMMFVFADLIELDDRSIQAILREISTETLVLALKASDDEMREKIFRNMSKRAAELLRDDLGAMGPIKLSDAEAAQKEVLGVARRLSDEGKISLGGKEEYV